MGPFSIRPSSLRHGARVWLAALAVYGALVSAGVPCICACAGESADAGCHDEHAAMPSAHGAHPGEDRDQCPPSSPCLQDQVLAIGTHPEGLIQPAQDMGVISGPAEPFQRTGLGTAVPSPHAPDRSPPIPPGFAVLRI